MKIAPKPSHLMLRFSDQLRIAGDTIPEHMSLLERHGFVWYGKFGRPVSVLVLDKLKKQIEAGINTNLYLVQKKRKGYETHFGQIITLTRIFGETERELIPSYYFDNNLIPQISLWVKINSLELLEPSILNTLIVSSSSMPVRDSLATSMAAHFIVKESLKVNNHS